MLAGPAADLEALIAPSRAGAVIHIASALDRPLSVASIDLHNVSWSHMVKRRWKKGRRFAVIVAIAAGHLGGCCSGELILESDIEINFARSGWHLIGLTIRLEIDGRGNIHHGRRRGW
jgi:hypothetical protein